MRFSTFRRKGPAGKHYLLNNMSITRLEYKEVMAADSQVSQAPLESEDKLPGFVAKTWWK